MGAGVPAPVSVNRTKVAHNEAGPQMSHHHAEKGNLDNSEFIRQEKVQDACAGRHF